MKHDHHPPLGAESASSSLIRSDTDSISLGPAAHLGKLEADSRYNDVFQVLKLRMLQHPPYQTTIALLRHTVVPMPQIIFKIPTAVSGPEFPCAHPDPADAPGVFTPVDTKKAAAGILCTARQYTPAQHDVEKASHESPHSGREEAAANVGYGHVVLWSRSTAVT
jgi:hypothetical protein